MAATALAALVPVATWSGALLVVGGHVVRGWALSALLAVAAVALRRVARSRRGACGSGDDEGSSAGARAGLLLSWPMTSVITLIGVGAALGAAGNHVVGTAHVTLTPVSPQGCRVIVRETSFLFSGSGDVYAVPAGTGVGRRVGSCSSDDGCRPASRGTYELVWDDGSGAVVLHGDATDPVHEQSERSFTC